MADDAHILVVDDDQRLRGLLHRYLADNGLRVTVAESAEDARDKLRFLNPDLMVLDVMMPGEDGLSLVESLRRMPEHRETPVLLLTARDAPDDQIAGFEAGADDYLNKPFEPKVLVLRIRAMLRRTAAPVSIIAAAGPIPLGEAAFDMERGELWSRGLQVRLTGGEAALLMALARNANSVLSREDIAEALGMDDSSERAIDVQVTRLRRKIEADPREPRYLMTVRSRGYVLKPGK